MSAKAADFSLILKLLAGIVIGSLIGTYLGNNTQSPLHHIMDAVVSLRYIFGQIIFFLVPLVIVGFITPAIVRLGQNASKILFTAVAIAYISSIGAAFFSTVSGYIIIPHLSIATSTETLRKLPEIVFQLDIPPLFSVMSALVLALFFGVAITWTKSENLARIFAELERVMSSLVVRIMIPILPFFVGMSFLGLAYEGSLSLHLPVFISWCSSSSWALHLACRALRHRRRALRPQSLGGVPLLHSRLSHRRGHHVQRRHPARGPRMRPQVPRAQQEPRGIHDSPRLNRASVRLRAHRNLLLHDPCISCSTARCRASAS